MVTAGAFASACAALQLPEDVPIWIDWPSDPMADLHAKLHAPQSVVHPADIPYIQALRESVVQRSDAISVISKRQYWVTLSQLLVHQIGEAKLHQRIHPL